MADISLLFDVAGGGSIDGESGKEIYKQLNKIVEKINENPFKIKFEADETSYNAFKEKIDKLKKEIGQISIKIDTGDSSGTSGLSKRSKTKKKATPSYSAVRETAELLEGKTDELNAIFVRINRLKKRIEKDLSYTSAKHGKSKNEYKIIDGLVGDVEAFERDIGTFTKDGAINKIKALEKILSDAEVVFDKNNEKSKTFADRIKAITKRFSEWFGVTHLITQAYQMLRRMVTAVVDIDSAMTELKKVTNETAARYDSFLRNATVRAKNLGAALSDTVRATADFARLGYSIDEAEKMADAAIIYKNVGDGIQDINTASESIIATMQAFGVKANEVMTIVDKFNEVGNNFAVSSSGIGDALLRSASAMHSAGNTIDETIALVAAANTIVQNPETVGRICPTA